MPAVPFYRQIENYLLGGIRSGEFPLDSRIPTEEQLARDFGVSRMTVNKAIRELVHGGYLVRHSGIGTFVTKRKAESSVLLVHNIADEVRDRGGIYSNKILCREELSADPNVARQLEVTSGTTIYHSCIVHREDGIPIQLEDRYVNANLVPHYLETNFSRHTPNEILVHAHPISNIEHIVEAVNADEQIAAQLEMGAGQACISMQRRTW